MSDDEVIELVITPAMIRAGASAVWAAEGAGEYGDKASALVLTAMLAACDHPKFRVRISDAVDYAADDGPPRGEIKLEDFIYVERKR